MVVSLKIRLAKDCKRGTQVVICEILFVLYYNKWQPMKGEHVIWAEAPQNMGLVPGGPLAQLSHHCLRRPPSFSDAEQDWLWLSCTGCGCVQKVCSFYFKQELIYVQVDLSPFCQAKIILLRTHYSTNPFPNFIFYENNIYEKQHKLNPANVLYFLWTYD